MALDIVIKSEEEAWDWFKKALENDSELTEGPVTIKFDGWPILDLQYNGQDFDSSVPTRIMPPLLLAQDEIHRLFCQVQYGQQSTRRLKVKDRENLELVVKVEKGSSLFQTNYDEILNQILQTAVSKMSSTEIVILGTVAALTWGANVAWKNWLEKQAKDKELDSRVKLSQEETERLKLFAKAEEKIPELKHVTEGVDEFRNNSLRKLKPSDSFTVPGSETKIDGHHASEITHKPREQSVEVRFDGEFVIQSVVSGETKGFKIKVKDVLNGKVINVSIPEGTLKIGQVNILKNNEWAKKPIFMDIIAKELRGEITSATLVSASEIQEEPPRETF